jgi:LuxR family transcriptional regulator, maltose regulon positive regulatory protein
VTNSDGAEPDRSGTATERAVLLGTKVHVPAGGDRLVHRPALLDALAAGRRRKLMLLSAPAGWGKTTLLAQWASSAQEDQRFSWLSLDTSDNDPVWFWMYAVAALQRAKPELTTRTAELLAMGADPLQVVLPTLFNELATVAGDVVFILDDYHLVTNRAVHEQVAFFISRMPPNLHLVLATRSDPMLPLARLRASGDLAEVRTDDLRFAAADAGRLLNDVLGLGLADADIQLLCQRTEGWAAGLYLAALSLTGRSDPAAFIRSFAGDNRHIVDYLMAEVLDGQPPHLVRFLVRSSVLGRLSGELCNAVLEESDSASILEEVDRENMFLVPLDVSRHWYRYHHLFGELLRAELRRTEPDRIQDLHRRAATWFEGEGLIDEALRHLLAAGDIAKSADLIAADWAEEVNGGGLSTISSCLDLLPYETVSQDPRLSIARAWIALNVGQLDEAASWIEKVEAKHGTTDGGGTVAHGGVLRALHSFKTGDVRGALETARRAVTLRFGEASLARSDAHCVHGSALLFSGKSREAQAAFQQAAQVADNLGDRRALTYALGYLAMISAEHAQHADAELYIRRASGSGRDLGEAEHYVDVMVSLAAAIILDARSNGAAALFAADMAVTLARQGGALPELAKALLVRADILERSGGRHTAKANLEEVEQLVRRSTDCGVLPALLAAAERGMGISTATRGTAGTTREGLTPKEFEVLRLLATRLSRREIAEHLFVSLNTVKTHQRSLYRKLDADDRDTALARARNLGLL